MTRKSIKNTLTEKNLLTAFSGESQARNRYTYYAKTAQDEGYEQIAAIFIETAEQEKTHAQRFFEQLEGGKVEITASYPAGRISSTIDNLKEAACGEREEWQEMYPEMAETALDEGFPQIALLFRNVAKAEREHEARFIKLLERLTEGSTFSSDIPVEWQCRQCGYVHSGTDAPAVCPSCHVSTAYFERKRNNY